MKTLLVVFTLTLSSFSFAQSANCKKTFNAGVANFDKGVVSHNNGVTIYNTINGSPTTAEACVRMKKSETLFNSGAVQFDGAAVSFKAAQKVCDPKNVKIAKENTVRAENNATQAKTYRNSVLDLQIQFCKVELE